MSAIHPTAVVDPGAQLAADVEVGPFAVIGAHVIVGTGTRIGAHAVLDGHTTIGRDNTIHPFATIGGPPQDKKYRGEPTRIEIGDRNTIREYVTINTGTVQDVGVTRLGDDNWIMAYVHIAHDCQVGNQTIFANSTNLGGHVEIGDWAILGGYTGVHQFCKIGAHAMTSVGTVVLHDLPPFVMAAGDSAKAHGINSEGLRRRGFSPAAIDAIRRAYKTLYRSGRTLEEARAALAAQGDADGDDAARSIALIAGFLERVTRGIVR